MAPQILKPVLNNSGRDDLPEGDPICFIATVVYGDVNAPQVEALRNYRDDVMMRSLAGRKMIELYYSGLGERVAYFVRDKIPRTTPTIKRCLDCFIESLDLLPKK